MFSYRMRKENFNETDVFLVCFSVVSRVTLGMLQY